MILDHQHSIKLKYGISSFKNLRINYWSIPKCGNTSIKYALLRAEDPERFKHILSKHNTSDSDDVNQWIHSVGICTYIRPDQANNNGFTNFTVIREPVSRLLSGYMDFTQKRPSHGMGGSHQFVTWFRQLRRTPSVFLLVHLLEQCPDPQRDVHFRSQKSYCLNDDLVMLKLVNIATTIKKINPDIVLDVKLHTTGEKAPLAQDLADRINKIYHHDAKLWEKAEE